MDKDKFENYIAVYEELIQEGNKILDNCGWDGKSYKNNFPDKYEYITFFEKTKSLILEVFGSDSIYYTQLVKNLDKFYTSTAYFNFIYRTLEDSYKILKDLDSENKNIIHIEPTKNESKDLNEESKQVFLLSYNDWTREIYINDKLLKRPQLNSANHIIFEYLYKNANTEISLRTLQEIVEKELGYKFTKSLTKVANDLGFTRDRRKLFFITSKNSAILRTKITREELYSSKINIENILPK